MGPAFYVLAILGCGEGEVQCQQVSVAQARYESVEACNEATPDAVMRSQDISYPVVVAQCRRADAAEVQKLTGADVDLPEPVRERGERRTMLAERRTGR
jgi:hypothetical protein